MTDPRPRRYDLIVFDWDGTLCDSTALIVSCMQAAARDLDVPEPTPEQARFVIGMALPEALAHAVPGLPTARYPELVQAYRRHWFAQQDAVVLYDGSQALLEALRARHHWLAVATGKSRRGLDEALQTTGLGLLFDATRTADETAGKPHPQMLMELMDTFGVTPERTVMIGDTTHDLQMARNAGVDALAIGHGAHAPDLLQGHAPLALLDDIAQLRQWLEAHA